MTSLYDQILSTLYAIWRKRWYGLATMWGICLIGWAIVAYIPDEFEATARIFVEVNDSPISRPGDISSEANTLKQVDRVRRTLVSRPNLEKVIRRTDMDLRISNDSEMEKLIDGLLKNITIKSQGDDLFTLSYRAVDSTLSDQERASLAKRVVQSLVDLFVEGSGERSGRDRGNSVVQVLDQQIAEYERRLQEAEQKRKEFQLTNNILPGKDLSQQIGEAQTEIRSVEQRLVELRSARSVLATQLNSIPQFIEGSGVYFVGQQYRGPEDTSTTKGRIDALKRQIADGLGRGWSDQHPDIANARQQISDLEKQLAIEKRADKGKDTTPKMQNPLYVSTRNELITKEADIAATQARYGQLSGMIGQLGSKAATAPEMEAEQAKLNRDYEVLKRQQQALLERREEVLQDVTTNQQLQPYKIQLVDPPVVPLKPVAPNRVVLLSAVLIAGLLLGLGVSFVLSQMHTTYITVTRLREAIQVPVLGGISSITTDQQRNQSRLWLGVFGLAMTALLIIYGIMLAFEVVQANTAI
jgi:polysaccharide biosynthesis transport protein